MSDSTANLRRKINSASDLQSVVRTMKALASSNINQYEQSVLALADYSRSVNLGLGACLRADTPAAGPTDAGAGKKFIGAIVFGSDQGLVGQFNDIIADHAISTLADMPGTPQIWAVGERVQARLADSGLPMVGNFAVPTSVRAIAPLVADIQLSSEAHRSRVGYTQVYLFYNRPEGGAGYQPVSQRLLPLDAQWRKSLAELHWPTKIPPQIISPRSSNGNGTLRALIGEYLFISLFRACAESLASENSSRLAAMQRADKNIDELLDSLHSRFNKQRQSSIDEELFDVISGYEALGQEQPLLEQP